MALAQHGVIDPGLEGQALPDEVLELGVEVGADIFLKARCRVRMGKPASRRVAFKLVCYRYGCVCLDGHQPVAEVRVARGITAAVYVNETGVNAGVRGPLHIELARVAPVPGSPDDGHRGYEGT